MVAAVTIDRMNQLGGTPMILVLCRTRMIFLFSEMIDKSRPVNVVTAQNCSVVHLSILCWRMVTVVSLKSILHHD